MIKISDTCKNVILWVFALSLIASGIGCFFVEDIFSCIIGILFGSIFSALKMILLEKTLEKSVNMPPEKATNYVRLHYTLRYFLTFAVLLVGALADYINIFGVIIGLVVLRPAIYLSSIKNK